MSSIPKSDDEEEDDDVEVPIGIKRTSTESIAQQIKQTKDVKDLRKGEVSMTSYFDIYQDQGKKFCNFSKKFQKVIWMR